MHEVGSCFGFCRHKSLEQKKDPLLTPEARASDDSKGSRPGRFQLRPPRPGLAGGGGGTLGQSCLPAGVCGRPGPAGFPESLAPTATQALPTSKSGHVCPLPGPTGETAARVVGNGDQPKAETKITQREKQEGPAK